MIISLMAIMLGSLRMSVPECIEAYLDYSKTMFDPKRSKWNSFIRPRSQFDETTLMDIIRRTSTSNPDLDNLMLDSDSPCKVYEPFTDRKLCSVSTADCHINRFTVASESASGDPVIFRNYETPREGPYNADVKSLKLWEVARATSASPTYFKPVMLEARKRTYIDGSSKFPNPVRLLYREARDIWPDSEVMIISIGTGGAPRSNFSGSLRDAFEANARMSTDAEMTADDFGRQFVATSSRTSYYRFNAHNSLEDVGLEEWRAYGAVEAATRAYLTHGNVEYSLSECIHQLSEINYEGSFVVLLHHRSQLTLFCSEAASGRGAGAAAG
jgi:predicted acylesterase/phospholipase RssA